MSGLYPGAVGALADNAKLVEAKEWTALAALVSRAGEPEALGALASAADDREAFAWMWAVFNPDDPRHLQQIVERLVDGAAVPDNRRDAVGDFVLAPDPLPADDPRARQVLQRQPNGPAVWRRAAQERVLTALNPATDLARRLARAVLEAEEGRYWPGLQHAAFDALGASRRKVDRSEVVERASALVPRERLRPLAGLASPLQRGEEKELLRHLDEALPLAGPYPAGGFPEEDYWASARALAGRLSAPALAKLLSGTWARHEGDRERLFSGEFVARLDPDVLRALLASDLDGAVRRQLIRSASSQLPLEAMADLGRWTHENLDPEWSRPLRERISSDARPPHYGSRSSRHEQALRALRDFAFVCDDPATASNYAACLTPGEAPVLADEVPASGRPPERVGRVAGALLHGDGVSPRQPEEEAVQKDVAGMLDLYPADKDRALFLSGLLEPENGGLAVGDGVVPPDPKEEERDLLDLQFLGAEIVGRPDSSRVFVEAGYGFDLVPAAYDADDPREAFLEIAEAAIEHLGDDAVETVLRKCGWSELDDGRYGRFVTALKKRPGTLLREAASALDSLPKPDAEAVPAGHLRTVLRAALDTAAEDLAGAVGDRYGDQLRDLLNQRDVGLRRLALRWALALEPEEDVVGLLIAKRESTHGLDEEFAEVLAAYARHLSDRARDGSLDSEERARALKLARAADQEEARGAAFAVAEGARAQDLRLAAASVLADTEARPEDEKRLENLLDDEGDADTRRLLAAALRNISSGTLTRALENLRSLVGLPSRPEEDPRTSVPEAVWDARFVGAVDRARRNSAGEPGAYVNALVVLADLLVDVAVAERHYADPNASVLGRRSAEHAAALRENANGRPDTGELLKRPNLIEAFPWLRQVGVLRGMRGAHPAPIGSTDPVRVGDDDAGYARRLFRDVVAGWEASMRETRRRASRA